MRVRRSLVLGLHELVLVARDPGAFIALLVMPFALMFFFKPSAQALLRAEGFESANGSEQTVPGTAVMFGLFLLGTVGGSFLKERAWKTWNRLRTSHARPREIIAGKVVPLFAVAVGQQLALFLAGYLVVGLRSDARPQTAVLVMVMALSFAAFVVALGVLLATFLRSIPQLVLVQAVATVVLGGIGGALTPHAFLPGWVQAAGKLTPSHWAVAGYRSAIVNTGSIGDVVRPAAALITVACVLAAIASARFRFEEEHAF